MESAGQFERLIRMVQETGERVVVSLEKGKDPVVLLPLSVYEQLVGGRRGIEGGGGISRGSVGIGGNEGKRPQSEVPNPYPDVPRRRNSDVIGGMENGLKPFHTDMSRGNSDGPRPHFDVPRSSSDASRGIPCVTEGRGGDFKPVPVDMSRSDAQGDAVDAWDGEEGGEYDAERIFAQIDREKKNNTPSQAPDRLQASVSRASEALHGGWPVGSGGQRLPIRGQALQGEERFSLGVG